MASLYTLEEILAYFKNLPVEVFVKKEEVELIDFDEVIFKAKPAETYTLYVGFKHPFTNFDEYNSASQTALARGCFYRLIDIQAHRAGGKILPAHGTCFEDIGTGTITSTINFKNGKAPVVKEKTIEVVNRAIKIWFYPSLETAQTDYERSFGGNEFSPSVFSS